MTVIKKILYMHYLLAVKKFLSKTKDMDTIRIDQNPHLHSSFRILELFNFKFFWTMGTNFFDSACWTTCLRIKAFMLSLWMMCDVVLDVKSCVGYYKLMQNETKTYTELFKNDTGDTNEEVKVCIYCNMRNNIVQCTVGTLCMAGSASHEIPMKVNKSLFAN